MLKSKNILITVALFFFALIISGCSSNSSESSSGTDSSETTVSPVPSESADGDITGEPQVTPGFGNGGPAGGAMGGAVDKSGDTELQSMISEVVEKFHQLEYTDSDTGETIPYNLYIPENYDSTKTYPLVLFIADSSVVGQDTTAPLTQGYGGIIWATEAEQAKHESFILVPEYPSVIIDDHGSFTTTDYIEMTVGLLNSVTSSYSIDTNRLYGTGQSMGCMTILCLSTEHPDLFAAELFVSGQWDISTLNNLSSQKFFYIAAEGDEKASGGQTEVEEMLKSAGTLYSTATWDATWSTDEFNTAVSSIVAEGNNINFATFKLGTVLPSGVTVGTNEHMYSFDYAYKIEAVRNWLFNQSK